jgi:thymidylate synthase (FAD)
VSIRIITEPSVYLVGRQAVVYGGPNGLGQFLRDNGTPDWSSTSTTPAEVLVEVGGRLCYQSFGKPRPGGNAAYVRHILEVAHGCYDGETDVLTASGWKNWGEVSEDDEFATRNAAGEIEYQRSTGLISAPYRGKMYRVAARGVDLLVTPNHRMFVCPTTTKEGRTKQDFRFVRADELGDTSHAYVKTGTWCHDSGSDPKPAIAKLLGFSIGDGTIGSRSGTVKFHLRRRRKIEWLASAAAEAGWKLTGEGDRFTLHLPNEWIWFFRGIYNDQKEKQIPQRILTEWSFYGLLNLYNGLMEADGHKGETGDSFDTTSPILTGQFQQLCLHLGVAANVCYTLTKVPAGGSFGTKPITRLTVITRETRPEVNKFANAISRSSWVEDWEGTVYCAEVPNGTLYVRRNGKPVWCGNSVLEHAVYTFIVTGVSRSLTHELVRHRVGLSPSQLSQRYVDESEVAFVCPPALLGSRLAWIEKEAWPDHAGAVPDAIRSGAREWRRWLDAREMNLNEYGRLVKDLAAGYAGKYTSPTDARKAAREAARSVLPNCTETKIQLTGNARAWRHLLEMRGGSGADAEIRRLALAILPPLAAESPALFGDYSVDLDDDGREVITTPYRKV